MGLRGVLVSHICFTVYIFAIHFSIDIISNIDVCSIYHRANSYWSFVPIFAPFIGAIFGVMVYQLMVGYHVEGEARDKREAEEKEEKERLKLSAVSEKETA